MSNTPLEVASAIAQTTVPGVPGDGTFHRSGAVARMLRMPVATLRVWERRYRVAQPQLSPSGQRLYSADDVRRLALIKQLTDLGHAIGGLASMDMAQLHQVAAMHAQTLASSQRGVAEPPPACRMAVVGAALWARLQRPAVRRRLHPQVVLRGPFDDPVQASAALRDAPADVVLIHAPHLHEGWRASILTAAPSLAAVPVAVLYGFAPDAVCEALANAGTALLRDPQPDAVLAQWLNSGAQSALAPPALARAPRGSGYGAPPRWTDAALADFAGLSSTVACECPRHVAELLMQLSHFEAYSAECEQRSVKDAELHADLRRVAAQARATFELALEQVALHEGLLLPPTQALSRP
jgi:DNA-binding transcriptional MerR regulator